jgi:hypothetical protein
MGSMYSPGAQHFQLAKFAETAPATYNMEPLSGAVVYATVCPLCSTPVVAGLTQLMRRPWAAYSAAALRTSPTRACLLAE